MSWSQFVRDLGPILGIVGGAALLGFGGAAGRRSYEDYCEALKEERTEEAEESAGGAPSLV